jgi:hypothetical protein
MRRRISTAAATALAALLLLAPQASARPIDRYPRIVSQHEAHRVANQINHFFTSKRHRHEARAVSSCESKLNRRARNGQYWGLFQLGETERGEYGWRGWTIKAEVRAAHTMFKLNGHSWARWGCDP